MIVIFLNAFTFTNFLKLLLAVAESASPAMDSNFLPVKKRLTENDTARGSGIRARPEPDSGSR